MFPHTVTLYTTEIVTDMTTMEETETHYITILRGVMLTANKARNVVTSGLEGADAVTLYIPATVEAIDGETGEPKTYVAPIAFHNAADKTGVWTLAPGSLFVKGEAVAYDKTVQAIEAAYDFVYDITTVDYMDYGGDMAHWEVGGN